MSNILPLIAPSLISIIVILISLYASKNSKSLSVPNGFVNFLEALVVIAKSITRKVSRSKFLKVLLIVLVGVYLIVEVLMTTNLWTTLTAPKNATGTTKTEKVKTAKAPKAAPTKEAKETGPEFVPYLRAGTADLNTTIALALISIIATQVIGIKFLGIHYFKKYVNFKGPIDAFVGMLETVSEISKIISFSFRLFGNVFAGEVLLAVIYYLLPVIVPIPFLGLEIFVGAIQAFVFATLSLVFMNLATQGHGGEEHHETYA